jgi:hypothetical protein
MTTSILEPPDVVDVDQAAAGESDGVSPGVPYDPEAPYGINPRTGKPYKRDPEWRAKLAETLARGRQTQARQKPPGRTRAKPSTPRSSTAGSIDYRPAVMGLMQIPTALFAVLARATGKAEFALDSAACRLHAPTLAAAAHDTAMQDPRMAAILDRALAAGPYAALIGAAIPFVLQLAANHHAVEPVAEMGILPPEDLIRAAYEQPT